MAGFSGKCAARVRRVNLAGCARVPAFCAMSASLLRGAVFAPFTAALRNKSSFFLGFIVGSFPRAVSIGESAAENIYVRAWCRAGGGLLSPGAHTSSTSVNSTNLVCYVAVPSHIPTTPGWMGLPVTLHPGQFLELPSVLISASLVSILLLGTAAQAHNPFSIELPTPGVFVEGSSLFWTHFFCGYRW